MLGRILPRFAGALALVSMFACSSEAPPPPHESDIESGGEVDETADELTMPFWFATVETAVCPSGAKFDPENGFCTQGGRALGPFTKAMVAACTKAGDSGCDGANWPIATAVEHRGNDTCPLGASIDKNLGVCVEDGFAYGPFDRPLIDACMERGGEACNSLRWDTSAVEPLLSDEEIAGSSGESEISTKANGQLQSCGGLNERLMAHYSSRSGYDQVSRAGMRTLGTRRNGCAAWLSHAIRQAGQTNMPIEVNTENVRDALRRLGWTTVRKADLRPGDVVITQDRRGRPGHPDHVYMFAGWSDAARTTPLAVDNQGFTHARGRGKSPIAYGLRAPNANRAGCNTTAAADGGAKEPPQQDSCTGKANGWYCSDLRDFSAYKCESNQIAGGWQCADNTVCRKDASGKATLYQGGNPGCFGSR